MSYINSLISYTYSRYSWLDETLPTFDNSVEAIVPFSPDVRLLPVPELLCADDLGPVPDKSEHLGVFQGLLQ